MFAGLMDVDWAALEHAYGSAEDVPGMLRRLATDDEAECGAALDELGGAVHRRGEVYDSTLACLPFLFELAADSGVAGRGWIVELIASIGAAEEAREAVRGRADEILGWLADDDAAVRRAAVGAVAACLADGEAAAGLWLERMFGDAAAGADVRLAAFVELTRLRVGPVDEDVVQRAVGLVGEVGEVADGALFRGLDRALEEHVAGRVALIEGQLRCGDAQGRIEALRAAGELMRGWRGEYSNLVALIGEQISAAEPQVARMALIALKNKFDLVGPATEALARRLAVLGADAWDSADPQARKECRDLVVALARFGDERVLPVVETALTQDLGARVLGGTLGRYRAHAGRLAPVLREQLRLYGDELGSDAQVGLFGLLAGVRELGAVEAVPEVMRVLEAAVAGRKRLVMEVALQTLASLGPGAAAARELVAGIAADKELDGHVVVRAVEAAWRLGAAAEELLPLLEPRLLETDWFADGAPADRAIVTAAAEVAGVFGAQAAPLAGRLRTLMESAEDQLTRVEGALALISVLGPGAYSAAEYALEVGWREAPQARLRIAECVRDLGSAAASFHPTLRAELAEPYRHLHVPGVTDSDEVGRDERLSAACAETLSAAG
ncbi:MAG TPA: hypothetical protein VFN97_19295 [Actinospica sp.]|nr:hypothetical protein [Actinospica sp.]